MSIINKGILDSRTAYLRQVGNDWPTAQVISSSDITEGINLYFTNARVYSNVIASLPSLAGTGMIIQANGQINANAQALSQSLTLAALSPFLTTSNVSEGSNLYYTNARVLSALTGNVTVGNLTATSIVINTSVANSYTTTGNVTTTAIQANIWTGLYTANVRETAANLYFTNARVLSALTGGALLNSYVATFRAGIQQTVYNLPLTPISNNYVTVNINGVTQLSNAYTVSGNTLTLSGYPVANADIDVRIIDIAQAVSKDFNSRLFYGNSVANTTVISNNFTDSSILVFENGIAQVPGIDYTASGGVLRFATAPRTGVTVEIRELPTLNGTGTYVGGQNIQVLANGQINATSTVQDQIHPFLLSLL